jgi:hypothetical protein
VLTDSYWSFTTRSLRPLLVEVFGDDRVVVEAHGNVLAAVRLLHGLAVQDCESWISTVGIPSAKLS